MPLKRTGLLNKVKAELTSRALRKEIADLDAQSKKIADKKGALTQKLDNLRKSSDGFVVNWSSVGITGSSITASLQFDTLEGSTLRIKEIWLNDRIYIDACGIHNLDEKEEK